MKGCHGNQVHHCFVRLTYLIMIKKIVIQGDGINNNNEMEKTCNLKGNAAAGCTSFESEEVTNNVIRRWQGLGCVK